MADRMTKWGRIGFLVLGITCFLYVGESILSVRYGPIITSVIPSPLFTTIFVGMVVWANIYISRVRKPTEKDPDQDE